MEDSDLDFRPHRTHILVCPPPLLSVHTLCLPPHSLSKPVHAYPHFFTLAHTCPLCPPLSARSMQVHTLFTLFPPRHTLSTLAHDVHSLSNTHTHTHTHTRNTHTVCPPLPTMSMGRPQSTLPTPCPHVSTSCSHMHTRTPP